MGSPELPQAVGGPELPQAMGSPKPPRAVAVLSRPEPQQPREKDRTNGPSEENNTLLQDDCFNRTTSVTPGGLQPPFNQTAANTLTDWLSGCVLKVLLYYRILF
ncbi:hypothetical protein TURU_019206 [Turdus rufiventris]|nr:hypothetical protein TURU_019206 [Turdus rufiventris]